MHGCHHVIDVNKQMKPVVVLLIYFWLVSLGNGHPIEASDGQDGGATPQDRLQRRAAPCFNDADCLKTQICKWDPTIAELAGTCVFQRGHFLRDTGDQFRRPRFRRGPSSVDGMRFDGSSRDQDPESNSRFNNGYSIESPPATTSINNVPQGSFPLRHTIHSPGIYNTDGDDDDDDDDDVVVDHLDDRGLSVVVISSDNRDARADYDTAKDVVVLGAADDDSADRHESRRRDAGPDENPPFEFEGDYGGDGDERRVVVVDPMGGGRRSGLEALFANPWGLQPMRGIMRPVDLDVPIDGDDLYLTDDVQIYGAGDEERREGQTFEHHNADYTGTGIEMDVGVAGGTPRVANVEADDQFAQWKARRTSSSAHPAILVDE